MSTSSRTKPQHQSQVSSVPIPSRRPLFMVVAGGPGAGKSTFIPKAIEEGLLSPRAFWHDCDAVMEAQRGYQNDRVELGSALAFQKWELPARKIAEDQLIQALEMGRDIIYDRSCALQSSLDFIKKVAAQGTHTLVFHFIFVEEEVADLRIAKREAESGRHIPLSVAHERWQGLKQLLPRYLALTSQAYFYDNTQNRSWGIPNRIATSVHQRLTIQDPPAFQKFGLSFLIDHSSNHTAQDRLN